MSRLHLLGRENLKGFVKRRHIKRLQRKHVKAVRLMAWREQSSALAIYKLAKSGEAGHREKEMGGSERPQDFGVCVFFCFYFCFCFPRRKGI